MIGGWCRILESRQRTVDTLIDGDRSKVDGVRAVINAVAITHPQRHDRAMRAGALGEGVLEAQLTAGGAAVRRRIGKDHHVAEALRRDIRHQDIFLLQLFFDRPEYSGLQIPTRRHPPPGKPAIIDFKAPVERPVRAREMPVRERLREKRAIGDVNRPAFSVIGVRPRPEREQFDIGVRCPAHRHAFIVFPIAAAIGKYTAIETQAATDAQRIPEEWHRAIQFQGRVAVIVHFTQAVQLGRFSRLAQQIVDDARGRRECIALRGDAHPDA
jgi:hypothetical protein